MKTGKIFITLLSFAALLLTSGCSSDEGKRPLSETAVNIRVLKVQNSTGREGITYSGTIVESESVPLSFSGLGTVSRVLVNEGDAVKPGQLLALLNDETYRNAYEMTLATLRQAEDAHKRLLAMYKNGNIPEIKLIEVETGLQQAKVSSAIAKKSLDDCKLYSPVYGIVGKRSIEPGMSAMPNLTSINIVKIEKVFARVSVSEDDISSIKKGQKAFVKVGALDLEFEGTVEEIGVLADMIAHTYTVKIGLSNKNLMLKPGMVCNISIERNGGTGGIVIPNNAIRVDEKGNSFVYTVRDRHNKALRTAVVTGKLLRDGIEIVKGLNEGDMVVIAGQEKLADNSLVKISY